MILANDKLLRGEREILLAQEPLVGFKSIYLEPFAKADQHAVDEIMYADIVVFGPGGLYTSLIPNLLVDGVGKALRETKAKKVFVANLMSKKRQTPGFTLTNYLEEIERFIGKDVFDHIIINNRLPPSRLLELYSEEAEVIENDLGMSSRIITADLIDDEEADYAKSDLIAHTRALIRHHPQKLAAELMKIVNHL